MSAPMNRRRALMRASDSDAKPVITSHPQSASIALGESVTFRVAATGKNLSYQWQYKRVGDEDWTTWAGMVVSTRRVTASSTNNGCQYRCSVSNNAGSVISDAATLTVIGA